MVAVGAAGQPRCDAGRVQHLRRGDGKQNQRSRRCSPSARWRATAPSTSPTPTAATASSSRIPSITRRTWAPPVRVSNMGPGGVALMPWIETGERPGSLADRRGTARRPPTAKTARAATRQRELEGVLRADAQRHVEQPRRSCRRSRAITSHHASNISLAGFTDGTSPNRNLADFFQVARSAGAGDDRVGRRLRRLRRAYLS